MTTTRSPAPIVSAGAIPMSRERDGSGVIARLKRIPSLFRRHRRVPLPPCDECEPPQPVDAYVASLTVRTR